MDFVDLHVRIVLVFDMLLSLYRYFFVVVILVYFGQILNHIFPTAPVYDLDVITQFTYMHICLCVWVCVLNQKWKIVPASQLKV